MWRLLASAIGHLEAEQSPEGACSCNVTTAGHREVARHHLVHLLLQTLYRMADHVTYFGNGSSSAVWVSSCSAHVLVSAKSLAQVAGQVLTMP